MRQRIEEILNQLIRPKLQGDGGDIEILDYNEGMLRLRLMGQCCTCPMASQTIEGFIKKILLEEVRDLKTVEVETGLSAEMLNIAKQYLKGGGG